MEVPVISLLDSMSDRLPVGTLVKVTSQRGLRMLAQLCRVEVCTRKVNRADVCEPKEPYCSH